MSTIELGSAAADLRVTVQRGSDKTFALRLLDGATNVSADFGAVLTVTSHGAAAVDFIADLETIDDEATLVWRLTDLETTELPEGSSPARLEIVHGDSLQETTIGIGAVIAQ